MMACCLNAPNERGVSLGLRGFNSRMPPLMTMLNNKQIVCASSDHAPPQQGQNEPQPQPGAQVAHCEPGKRRSMT